MSCKDMQFKSIIMHNPTRAHDFFCIFYLRFYHVCKFASIYHDIKINREKLGEAAAETLSVYSRILRYIPNKIFAMWTERWLFEKPGDEFMILHLVNIFLPQSTTSMYPMSCSRIISVTPTFGIVRHLASQPLVMLDLGPWFE